MTLLLDTHAFLWRLDDPQLLSDSLRKAIADGKNRVYISQCHDPSDAGDHSVLERRHEPT